MRAFFVSDILRPIDVKIYSQNGNNNALFVNINSLD